MNVDELEKWAIFILGQGQAIFDLIARIRGNFGDDAEVTYEMVEAERAKMPEKLQPIDDGQ